MLAPVEPLFRALAETFVPELAGAGEEEWRRVVATAEDALSRRPASVQRQVVLLVRGLGWLPLFVRARPFLALDSDARRTFLERAQNSRWMLLRRGVWGLRTLVFLGYYTHADTQRRLGYRAHRDGWEATSRRAQP